MLKRRLPASFISVIWPKFRPAGNILGSNVNLVYFSALERKLPELQGQGWDKHPFVGFHPSVLHPYTRPSFFIFLKLSTVCISSM